MTEVKRKVGRPKKVKLDPSQVIANPHAPVETLRKMGYDPIVETINTIRECDSKLRWIKKQTKPSQAAIAAVLATKRALNADLLKFGYRAIPEKVIQENHNFTFGIKLTDGQDTASPTDVYTEDKVTTH